MINDPNWLSDADWKRVQDSVPVACVDVLPVQMGLGGGIARVGLIYRGTPHQGMRWCLVGGRLWRNELFSEAVGRQVRETLGAKVRFEIGTEAQPTYVAQYFTFLREAGLLDPRQHAVAMVFVVVMDGEITPAGEAAAFRWFDVASLPGKEEWGFGQDRVARECLKRFKVSGGD